MSFGTQYGTNYEVINKIYTIYYIQHITVKLLLYMYIYCYYYNICVFKSHIMDILFKASPFTEWKHNITLVIANTGTHWCVQELVDCSALASHYQLITLHAHTVCMYTCMHYLPTSIHLCYLHNHTLDVN